MEALAQKKTALQVEIEAVEAEIHAAEKSIEEATAAKNEKDLDYWRTEKRQLRTKEEQLRDQLKRKEEEWLQGGREQFGFDSLKSRLEEYEPRGVDANMLRKTVMSFGHMLRLADDQLLQELYSKTLLCPTTGTRAKIKRVDRLSFNGTYHATPTRGVILIAFTEDLEPQLVKFAQEAGAIRKEHDILNKLQGVPRIVAPTKLVNTGGGSSVSVPDARGLKSYHCKEGLQMPMYPSTLAHVEPPMLAVSAMRVGKQILETLEGAHARGICHNDIKSPNIFIDQGGNCVVGDWGAAGPVGEEPRKLTTTHWPKQNPSGDVISGPTIDKFLLAVTLLERLGVFQLGEIPYKALLLTSAAKLDNEELKQFIVNDLLEL